ncbi:hypothetical protein [Mycobacteroides franklinii]|uniref:hypothetical protein n=1 Tax=Mycobacteroides franklinii TaxID=948102 RepID=UPI000992F42C|nr:hypothetical protein [Mycobacteroides franklinii]
MAKQYLWWELLERHGSTEAAWTWLRQNAQQDDTLLGGSQELVDMLWQEGLIGPFPQVVITMDSDSTALHRS